MFHVGRELGRWAALTVRHGESSRRAEIRLVQRAIVHSLRDMAAVDALLPRQIGDRSRDFQDAIVSARRKSQSRYRVLEKAPR